MAKIIDFEQKKLKKKYEDFYNKIFGTNIKFSDFQYFHPENSEMKKRKSIFDKEEK